MFPLSEIRNFLFHQLSNPRRRFSGLTELFQGYTQAPTLSNNQVRQEGLL